MRRDHQPPPWPSPTPEGAHVAGLVRQLVLLQHHLDRGIEVVLESMGQLVRWEEGVRAKEGRK